MAADPSNIFGFELLYKSVENQINKKDDVLITLVHWYFVRTGFRCIGTGDTKTFNPNEVGSELLPNGWNQNPNYALRYVKEGKLYILLGTKSDADLILNLMRIEDHSVSNIQFLVDTTVSALKGPLQTLMPSFQSVINTIRTDLVDPVYTGNARETSTQTSTGNVNSTRDIPRRPNRSDYDPLRVGPPQRPNPDLPNWNPMADPRGVGRSDLDPFTGPPGSGGMIFDPFSSGPFGRNPLGPGGPGSLGIPGRLPPGAVPPGARFDPFGPPDVNLPRPPRGGPDNDHLPPPGYDDMFM
ncbi:proteasome inhibitor PI31 subunit isoform X1 [Neodiprion lecontei]|uniref:Proteasome inhibitor PI31 subunit n=2 Tax=Neodiprion lecontei TaxID=441921 RepID=A0A6J0CBM8_NEOLC|nr:proteasome inhibitor PI31 subunit isoform X1 [Neodiprion lecontei]